MKLFLTLLFSIFIGSTISAQNGLYVFGQMDNVPGYPLEVHLYISSNPMVTTSFFTELDGTINTLFIETPTAWNEVYAYFLDCNDTTMFYYENPFPASIADVYMDLDYCENGISDIYGCTDPAAINYNPNANVDNGTCQYASTCDFNEVVVMMSTQVNGAEISWNLFLDSSLVYTGQNYSNNFVSTELLCLEDGCYTLEMVNGFGDGWNGAQISIQYNGMVLYGGSLQTGLYGVVQFGLNTTICDPISIYGCTDPLALNYNPSATIEDSTCVYPEPVVNDLCVNATALIEGIQSISNVGAVNNENIWGECWAYGSGEGEQTSIWFTFTTPAVPASIHIEALPDGSNSLTDTQFGIFETCGGEMIYCDGNSGQGLFSAFTFACGELELSTTYILMIDGYFGDSGTCLLEYIVDTPCEPVVGCTDVNSLNYNYLAVIDDGSCFYEEDCDANLIQIYFWSMSFSSEVNWNILDSDSTVVAFGNVNGNNGLGTAVSFHCLEDGCYTFEMYDASEDNGSGFGGGNFWLALLDNTYLASDSVGLGEYGQFQFGINTPNCVTMYGCTDPTANNYNPNATEDDGTCIYPEVCDFNEVIITTATQQWGAEVSWTITLDSMIVASGNGYSNQSLYSQIECLEDGCYLLNMYDAYGDGWNGGSINILMDGIEIINGTLNTGSFGQIHFGINAPNCVTIYGCMDPTSINYNPNATEEDGTCIYPEICDFNEVIITTETQQWGVEVSWNISLNSMIVASGNGYANQSAYTQIECLEDGCYVFNMYDSHGDGWNGGSFNILMDGVEIINGTLNTGSFGQIGFGVNATGCDTVVVLGCTDPNALNYNPLATINDGSCTYQEICDATLIELLVQTTYSLSEIHWNILDSDSSVVAFGEAYGNSVVEATFHCLEDGCYTFEMYETSEDNGFGFGGGWFLMGLVDYTFITSGSISQGEYGQFQFGINTANCVTIYGCMDPTAINYNPNASEDDGYCIYPEICDFNEVIITTETFLWGAEVSWTITQNSMIVASGNGYSNQSAYTQAECLEDGCYVFNMYDSYGDGWNGGSFNISMDGVEIINGTLSTGSFGQIHFGVNATDCPTVYGCTDASAINYNPLATEDDGTCEYQFGCSINFTVIPDSLGGDVIWILPSANINQAEQVTWDFGDGTTSNDLFPTHTYAGDGPYTLCVTALFNEPNGGYCSITYCAVLTYEMLNPPGVVIESGFTINILNNSVVLSANEFEQVESIKLWPNPATDLVFLSYDLQQNSNVTIKILDVTGKLILSFNNLGQPGINNFNFNVESLNVGLYFVEINTDRAASTCKFIVK